MLSYSSFHFISLLPHSISYHAIWIFSGPLLHKAFVAGVKILPYHCRLNPHTATVELLGRLPFIDLHPDSTDKTESEVKETKKQLMSTKKRKLKKDDKIENVSRISDMTVDNVTS